MLKFSLGLFILFDSYSMSAAISYHHAANKKLDRYLSEGVIVGGDAGAGFSLLNVRRHFASKKNIERLILDLGDIKGQPLLNTVSYFNISLEKSPARVIIDLAQVQRTSISNKKLIKLFKKSPHVTNVSLRFDPEDKSTNILLSLKKPMEIEVFKMLSQKKPSRIIIDLKEKK